MKEEVCAKKLQAVMALVFASNHEIDNPLAIALGSLSGLKDSVYQEKIDTLAKALWKLPEVVKSSQAIGVRRSVCT